MSKVSRENVALVAWEALREAGTPFVRLLRAANDALEATLKALGGKAAFQQAFASMSIDKSDEGLAKAFKKVDVDSSGYISAAEISAHVASVYGPMDESITTKMLKAADTDGDGEISLDEFKTVMRAGPGVKADGTLEDGTPLQEDVEDAVDADAPLTKQELEWIVAIRDAAATQSLPCTNVELVQLAMVTKGDTAKALSRLKKMAAWKKDLGLDDISFADAFRKVGVNATTNPDPDPINADSSVMRVPCSFRALWLVASGSMANEVLAFLLYGWMLPLLVPVFALIKSVAGATPVWAVEEWLLSWHTHDLRLFAHLRHAYARRAVSYRLHAGAAGVALLALLVLVLRAPAHPWLLRCTYLAASTLMALCGAKLVPTMYAGRHGRWWTRVQYQLVLAYNLAWLVGPPLARHFADHLALWLLLCAGVGERFYVLFFTPVWPAYDRQFAVATKCSWVFGVLSATFYMCKDA